MNRTKAIFLFLLIITIAGLDACSGDRPQAAPAVETVRMTVLDVQRANVPDFLEAVGTVRAAQTSVLASQTMGNVVELRAQEGDHVHRGEVLAVIDDSQPRAAMDRAIAAGNASQQQLAAADSDLSLSESTLKRYQTLYEKKSVSPQEFDEIRARQQAARARRDMASAEQAQAKAALAEARSAFDYTRIRAPFDGIISEKRVDSGSLASPGMPIFSVEDVRRYRLEATVNESDLAYVHIGQTVPIVIDALPSSAAKGRVAQIVPAADPGSRSFLVKIDLPTDPGLRSGLFGRAQISRGERTSLVVPRSAIVERGQLQGVFVLDQNRIASLRYVTLGKLWGENAEVLAGLQEGERLVVQPRDLDLNGRRIEPER